MNQGPSHPPLSSDEDAFRSLLEGLRSSWRWMIWGALLGFVSLWIYHQTLSPFVSTVILNNGCVTLPATDDRRDIEPKKVPECALTFARWRSLEVNLPALASDRQDQAALPKWLSAPSWWEKQVIPVYGLSQAESKKFAQMDEALKASSTQISLLRITSKDPDAKKAEAMADLAIEWIREGATFLDLRGLIDQYQSELVLSDASIASETLHTQIEAGYLRERLIRLRVILAQDLRDPTADQTRVNVGSVDTQFLPLRTQINAAEVALSDLEGSLRRLQDQAHANGVLRDFVGRAVPLLNSFPPGSSSDSLNETLEKALDGLKGPFSESDVPQKSAVERIRSDLHRVRGRYGVQLPEASRQLAPPSLGLASLGISGLLGALLGYFAFLIRKTLMASASRPQTPRSGISEKP